MINAKEVGNRIMTMLAKKNMSVNDLANLLYISNQACYKWLWGDAIPSIDNLVQLSVIFNCSIDYLIKGEIGGVI